MTDQPLISIVTPSYNQGKFIKHTLDSVLGQDYAAVEHIVMDGGSRDETVTILQQYPDSRLVWRSEKDEGQTDAINKGMRQVTGQILAYLNSDDLYLPGTLRFVASYFTNHPEVDILYGHCRSLDAEGNELPQTLIAEPFDAARAFLVSRWHIWQPAVFWRRRVMERIGLFDAALHYVMDYDYWLRMVVAGYIPQFVDRDLAAFRFHGESKSVSQSLKFYEELQQVYAKIYAMPDLPEAVARREPYSYAYLDFYQADAFWKLGQRRDARQYLRRILRGGAPLRLKMMALTMLVDSHLNTSLHKGLQRVYWQVTGTQVPISVSTQQFRSGES